MAPYRLSLFERMILLLILLIVATGFVLVLTDTVYFERYTVEDGSIEWLTVFGLLLCSAICHYRAFALRRGRAWYFFLTSFVLGLLLFLAAGEEISWGQRLLGIQSPEYFKENNLQGETNFHNLVVNGIKVNQIIFSFVLIGVLAIYLVVFPLLYRSKAWMKRFVDTWGIPMPRLYQVVSFLLLFLLTTFIPHGKRAEVLECGAAFLFFLIIYNPVNKNNFVKR